MSENEPPDYNWKLVKLLLCWILIVLAVILACRYIALSFEEKPLYGANNSISECFVSSSQPYYYVSTTYGALIEDIIECESGGDPCAKNPKSSAYGLCQFLDSTWEYVQNKWNMELDRDDPDDQRYACERLLREEGTSHWKASEYCWSN